MVFVVEYDRSTQQTLLFLRFSDGERAAAQDARLKRELELLEQGMLFKREVVLLEAGSLAQLRRTHERYMKNMPEGVSVT